MEFWNLEKLENYVLHQSMITQVEIPPLVLNFFNGNDLTYVIFSEGCCKMVKSEVDTGNCMLMCHQVCKTIQVERCRTDYKEECDTVTNRKCGKMKMKQKCQNVPERKCSTINEQKCKTVNIQQCSQVTLKNQTSAL